jgi:phosphoribosylformylglycinamidine synthase subunit PurQ / glutaminase
MKFGVIVFPGTNGDFDAYDVLNRIIGQPVEKVWHDRQDLDEFDCVILPAGFSYGDYLRTGAIARFSPVMRGIEKMAADGRLVLGICNGFQILLEAGLLPGAVRRNESLQFRNVWVNLRVENNHLPFTHQYEAGQVLKMDIAHGEGNYYVDDETLDDMKKNNQIVMRYCTPLGEITHAANPNGALENIAGICNRRGNVMGLMPHPERSAELLIGSVDGKTMFTSLVEWWKGSGRCDR